MLAKKIANRVSTTKAARRFGARVTYVCAKARTIETANLAGEWQDAARQMDFSAGLKPYLQAPVLHLALSWSEFENPIDAEMIDSMHRVIAELGGSEHQYVVGVHANRATLHVHGILNLVHPITGDALSLSHDYARMEKTCRRIEFEMEWPQDRGRFDCVFIDGDVHLMPKPAEQWDQRIEDRKNGIRHDGRTVRGHERRTGLPAFRDAISPEVMNQIRNRINLSKAWQVVHAALADHGLRYVLHRSGARIARMAGNWTMAASLGTAYGLGPMQARLGAYVAAHGQRQDLLQVAIESGFVEKVRGALITVEALRQEHRGQLEESRLARREIDARQVKTVKDIHSRLSSRRTVMAQAIRRILRQDYREEVMTWKSDSRAIRQRRFDTTMELEKLLPDVMHLRRYRHVLRKMSSDTGTKERSPADVDHTQLRQEWALAPHNSAPDLPEQFRAILTRFPDDVRADSGENLMLAKRNPRGSIVGYDIFDWAAFVPMKTAWDNGEGVGLLGPRNAETVIVVSDAKSALIQAVLEEEPLPLIITVPENLSPRSAYYMATLAKGRTCFIALGQAQKTADLRARIAELLPNARHRKRAPDELLQFIGEPELEETNEESLDAPSALDSSAFDLGPE